MNAQYPTVPNVIRQPTEKIKKFGLEAGFIFKIQSLRQEL